MKKWNLVIDIAKCFDCNMCMLAVHDEYAGNEFPGYAASMPKLGHRWIDIRRKERGSFPMVDVAYLPTTCNHCDAGPCVKAGGGAVTKRPDGIVIFDPAKAKGRKDLVDACPYGAVWWNEQKQLPQAWPFDAHLLDQGWTETRASQACPTMAMRTVKASDEEMAAMAAAEGLEVLGPELGTRPRVYYKNLHRFFKAFVGGSVAGMIDGALECIVGASVTLRAEGRHVGQAITDTFGDFRFDGLGEESGAYRVEISHAKFPAKIVDFELGASVNLGTIRL